MNQSLAGTPVHSSDSTARRQMWVIAILLLAFVLRLVALDARPIWYDESFSVLLSERDPAALVAGAVADDEPPLYYFSLHAWLALVGDSPFALRMLSVTLSMLGVALVYVVSARAAGFRAARWAMFLAAVAPFQVYYAQELRMYSLLAFALLLYLYAVMRLGSWAPATILAALSTALALYSHNVAILTVVSANVYLAFRRAWKRELQLIAAQVVGVILFVPWLLYVPGQLARIQRAFWTQPPGLADILQMAIQFTAYLPLPSLLVAVALFVSIAALVIAGWELARLRRHAPPPMLGLLLACAVVPPVLMFALSYVMRPIFIPRGVIASALAYYMILAILVARMPEIGRTLLGVMVCAVAGTCLVFLYTSWGEWRRAPFAQADQFLRTQMQPGDLILHDNKLSYFPMHYYDRTLPQQFLPDPAGAGSDTLAPASQAAMRLFPVERDAAVQGHARVWLVIFQTAIDEALAEGHPHGNLAPLDQAMRRSGVTNFGDLRIILYENR